MKCHVAGRIHGVAIIHNTHQCGNLGRDTRGTQKENSHSSTGGLV